MGGLVARGLPLHHRSSGRGGGTTAFARAASELREALGASTKRSPASLRRLAWPRRETLEKSGVEPDGALRIVDVPVAAVVGPREVGDVGGRLVSHPYRLPGHVEADGNARS